VDRGEYRNGKNSRESALEANRGGCACDTRKGWTGMQVHMGLVPSCPLQCVNLTSDRARRVVLAVVDRAVRVVRAVVLIMVGGSIWLSEGVRAGCLRVG